MNFDALVDEIVARVSAKIAQQESCGSDVGKPKLLILTEEHGSICHDMLESERLLSYYQTECALLKDYDCDMASYEAVILFGLTNEALARLAGGVCDTPFTRLAQKAILTGKKNLCPQGNGRTVPVRRNGAARVLCGPGKAACTASAGGRGDLPAGRAGGRDSVR